MKLGLLVQFAHMMVGVTGSKQSAHILTRTFFERVQVISLCSETKI